MVDKISSSRRSQTNSARSADKPVTTELQGFLGLHRAKHSGILAYLKAKRKEKEKKKQPPPPPPPKKKKKNVMIINKKVKS